MKPLDHDVDQITNLFGKSLISVAGGTMPKDFSFMVKAPGARPHAWWMS